MSSLEAVKHYALVKVEVIRKLTIAGVEPWICEFSDQMTSFSNSISLSKAQRKFRCHTFCEH